MPGRFVVTGLPRSRTAWLAAAASMQPDTICHHEPAAYVSKWERVFQLWQEQNYAHVGLSDAALGLALGRILELYAPRTLVVQRPLRDVVASATRLAQSVVPHIDREAFAREAELALESITKGIAPCLDHPLVRVVGFAALSDPEVVVDALAHLLPGLAIDRRKLDIAMRMNVQVDARLALAPFMGAAPRPPEPNGASADQAAEKPHADHRSITRPRA